MDAQAAFEQAQSTDQIAALSYAPGYTAYIREDEERNRLYINFCHGEMPPHSVERFDRMADMIAYLRANNWIDGWRVEAAE